MICVCLFLRSLSFYVFIGLMRVLSFFFFKKKTPYELRIRDGSSDVCSSDLGPGMANAVSGSGSGGEERPPARIGFKLLDDGSGNPDLAFRVLHPPSQDGGLVLQALDMRQPLLVEPDIRLPQRDGKIGRASCWERGWQDGWISGVGGAI